MNATGKYSDNGRERTHARLEFLSIFLKRCVEITDEKILKIINLDRQSRKEETYRVANDQIGFENLLC